MKDLRLTLREIRTLQFALERGIDSEMEFVDCHMRHGKPMKGAGPVILSSRLTIERMKRLQKKLAEASKGTANG